MLYYRPEKRCYPGDKNHRRSKQRNSQQHHRILKRFSSSDDDLSSSQGSAATSILTNKVSCEQLKTALLGKTGKVPCLCQDFESLQAHIESAYKLKNKTMCEICGEACWSKCEICDVPIPLLSITR
eukprot:scaffold12969_cov65-Attheya_sp.AAC.5